METLVRSAMIVGALAVSSSASAHIELLSPAARETDQKQGPCGAAGSVRGDHVTVAQSGSTLHMEWRETIDHPSHFRISIDTDGDDAFVDPTSYDDRFTNDSVLIDGISDTAGGTFSADVSLPDVVCDRCTDIYNPNVVRASFGTLFTLPVIEAGSEEALGWMKRHGICILAATPSAVADYTEVDMTVPLAIAVGTEQLGLSDIWMKKADIQVRIPMYGVADSLNVATATTLLLYEARRQRRL